MPRISVESKRHQYGRQLTMVEENSGIWVDAEATVLNKRTMCGIRIKLFSRVHTEMSE